MDRVELWIHEDNVGSQRLADALGFRVKGSLQQRWPKESEHHTMLVYGLWRHEWIGEIRPNRARTWGVEPVLGVKNVMESAEFYRDKLGFTIDFLWGVPPNHAGVSRSDWSGQNVTIQLSEISSDQPPTFTGALYIITDSNIDLLFEQYKATGVEIHSELQTYPWGMREFSIVDNSGYQLRFGASM